MRKIITAFLLGVSVAGMSAAADSSPRWLRNVAISPDGATIAFTYKGDVYTVPVNGGNATRLTMSQSYDSNPVWRPDGRQIVFSSNRDGGDDLYIIDAAGGTPRRLTTHSGAETPIAFVDNSTVLFSANLTPSAAAIQGPFQAQSYTLNVDSLNARPRMFLSLPIQSAGFAADGRMLYQDRKGYENIYRKHERSAGTDDIWLYNPADGKFSKLTSFAGHDREPRWAADGNSYFYVSEQDNNTLNVYQGFVDGKTSPRRLTDFERHPVRSLSADAAGKLLAFSWDGDIYTLVPGQQPKKVGVAISTDDYDADLVKRYVGSGAQNISVAPSGKEVAFTLRGDLYVTNAKYKTTRRITNTPAQERVSSFSPDGTKLVYDSDRDGLWQLFIARPASADEKEFAYASEIVEEPLYGCATSAQQPAFSPDGKKVAFLEDRTAIRVIDLDTKKVTTALDGKYNYSYSDGDVTFVWSPDSRWLLASYIGDGGWNNTDIALVAADGSEVVDLTESGHSDYNPKWVLDGKAITYASGKYGMKAQGSWGNQNDVLAMFLDGEAWDNFRMSEEEAELLEKENGDKDKKDDADSASKKKNGKKDKKEKEAKKDDVKPLTFDLVDRKHHTTRLTPSSSTLGDYYLAPKGDKFYYTASAPEGGHNLIVSDLRKNETKVLAKNVGGELHPDAKGESLFFSSNGGIKRVKLPSGEVEAVEFEAFYDRKPSAEREYIYDHMWKQVKDKFYDANLHGVDWKAYGEHYREFLPYIDNNRDFAILMSEILGELNASHTGASAYAGAASLQPSNLGAFFDESYDGDGLRVAELFPNSPLAAKKAAVKAGDIILSIDGEPIRAGHDYFTMLEGKGGRKVRLAVRRASGQVDNVVVKPMTGNGTDLLYRRWVERNQAMVDSLSGGRLAYVHVQGMNTPSFQTVYDQLLGKYRNREAVIVDTRYNGGGWLHNDIANLLSGKEYVRFMPRGRYIGSEPFSQWTKPSVMLVNESNYSDAHGTPFVYQTLGIGDIVGAPVPGTMTAVWWETQIDPTIVFGIPQVTSMGLDGTVLENHQLTPDLIIYNNPGDVIDGRDAQIEGAVRHLLDKLDK